jgi:hypothetical protein
VTSCYVPLHGDASGRKAQLRLARRQSAAPRWTCGGSASTLCDGRNGWAAACEYRAPPTTTKTAPPDQTHGHTTRQQQLTSKLTGQRKVRRYSRVNHYDKAAERAKSLYKKELVNFEGP